MHLVGAAAPYASLALPGLDDNPSGIGPVGGLRALLLRARADQSETALALACDLPFLDEATISAILAPFSGVTRVPFVEGRLQPGRGGQIARSAGNSCQVMAKEGDFATLKLPSGETRKIPIGCFATIGTIGNADYFNISWGKAGRSRWLGIRRSRDASQRWARPCRSHRPK